MRRTWRSLIVQRARHKDRERPRYLEFDSPQWAWQDEDDDAGDSQYPQYDDKDLVDIFRRYERKRFAP